jgi:hypothetical protein
MDEFIDRLKDFSAILSYNGLNDFSFFLEYEAEDSLYLLKLLPGVGDFNFFQKYNPLIKEIAEHGLRIYSESGEKEINFSQNVDSYHVDFMAGYQSAELVNKAKCIFKKVEK